ncbi:threonine/homoserine efflux transporter RhtA [Mucilaginibacter yixingensis]|uniref:Threonine/homoserine efflux transporter RhtA n=1 Tax=Mucilaginibacter yixingensis TaxID=1295612 RepID=A0A2T5J906_9SPHI|nr:DMT family transporter [Mucilaginibacter yixingensis]PTQ96558.1 threonine/homoserine efflux transporter RhtA [Mucilaginibacter yixingensis]
MKRQVDTTTYLMLFFGMVLFGSATPLSKLVTPHFPVFIAGSLRVLLAFLVLLPFIKLTRLRNYKGRDRWLLLGIALFGVLGFTALMLYGMKLVTGVTGSIVMSGTPAVTAAFSILFFKDALTWKKLVALLLAISGVLVLQWKGDPSGGTRPWLGVILIFAAVCCEAGYTLMGKALTKNFPPEEIAGLSALIAVGLFIPFASWQVPKLDLAKVSIRDWLALTAYGLVTMGLGSVLWYKGLARVEGTIAASFMGVMPVSALLLSYLLLGEKFRWLHMAGFALVFCGVLLMISVHRDMARKMK